MAVNDSLDMQHLRGRTLRQGSVQVALHEVVRQEKEARAVRCGEGSRQSRETDARVQGARKSAPQRTICNGRGLPRQDEGACKSNARCESRARKDACRAATRNPRAQGVPGRIQLSEAHASKSSDTTLGRQKSNPRVLRRGPPTWLGGRSHRPDCRRQRKRPARHSKFPATDSFSECAQAKEI